MNSASDSDRRVGPGSPPRPRPTRLDRFASPPIRRSPIPPPHILTVVHQADSLRPKRRRPKRVKPLSSDGGSHLSGATPGEHLPRRSQRVSGPTLRVEMLTPDETGWGDHRCYPPRMPNSSSGNWPTRSLKASGTSTASSPEVNRRLAGVRDGSAIWLADCWPPSMMAGVLRPRKSHGSFTTIAVSTGSANGTSSRWSGAAGPLR